MSAYRLCGRLGDVPVRHDVVMLVTSEVDTAIRGNLQVCVREDFKVLGMQRLEVGLVYGKEAFLTGVRGLLHTLLIMLVHLLGGCVITME